MTTHIKHIAARLAVATAVAVVGGCNNFLTGGETSTDPNRQTVATNDQYFVATQENLWAYWGSDPARLTGHHVSSVLQQVPGDGPELRLIVDDENGCGHGRNRPIHSMRDFPGIVEL